MSAEIKRRSLLRAALAGGVTLGLGQQAIAIVSSGGGDRSELPVQPDAAGSDERAILLRYGGELGGNKVGGRGKL